MKRNRWLILTCLSAVVLFTGFQSAKQKATPKDPLLAGFEKSTVASVADAVDQVIGKRGFMTHEMRPRVPGKFAGRALTCLLREAPPDQATPALSVKHSVAMLESAKPGEVAVIVIERGLDVAGIGGLMATTAKSRGVAGVVIDGGVRDVGEIRGLGLPVYARSVTPATSVGRWAGVASGEPVECGGVTVKPGDIIVAGEDGVVVVPREKEQEVLKRSQEIDERETKMVPFIQKYRSLTKAIQIFNRI